MIHLREADNIYFDESLVGFTRQLTTDGVVERQVDLLLVGAAYAIQQELQPLDTIRRHELIRVAFIAPDVRLAFEASLTRFANEQRFAPPETAKELLELLARVGSAGLVVLKERWQTLSPGQLRLRILTLPGLSSRRR